MVEASQFTVAEHAVKQHGLVDSALEVEIYGCPTDVLAISSCTNLEVFVVHRQRPDTAILLGEDTVDKMTLVGAVHANSNVRPLVDGDYSGAPPPPASWAECSLQLTTVVLHAKLVGTVLDHHNADVCVVC